jgi:hypothetical protein
MDVTTRLEQVERERAAAALAAEQERVQRQLHRTQVAAAIANQRRELIQEWSPRLHDLLAQRGHGTWKDGSFVVIGPDPETLTWSVIRSQPEGAANYQVTLDVPVVSPDDVQLDPAAALVVPNGFVVKSSGTCRTPCEQDALVEALVNGCPSPGFNNLTPWTQRTWAEHPYQAGESDPYNFLILIPLFLTCLVGFTGGLQSLALFGLVLSGDLLGASARLVGLGLSAGIAAMGVLGLRLTHWGRRYRRMSRGQRACAILASIPGWIGATLYSFHFICLAAIIIGVFATWLAAVAAPLITIRNVRTGDEYEARIQ